MFKTLFIVINNYSSVVLYVCYSRTFELLDDREMGRVRRENVRCSGDCRVGLCWDVYETTVFSLQTSEYLVY